MHLLFVLYGKIIKKVSIVVVQVVVTDVAVIAKPTRRSNIKEGIFVIPS